MVNVSEATPRTLWYRAKDTSASGCSGGGGGGGGSSSDVDSSDGGGNAVEIPPGNTGVAIGSKRAIPIEPTDAFVEETMSLGADNYISSSGGSPEESAPGSSGRCSGCTRGFNMYPTVEALLFIETMSTNDAVNCANDLTCRGNGVDSVGAHRAQAPGAKLRESAGEGQATAIQTTTTVGASLTRRAVDEETACSAGEDGGANPVLTGPTSLPIDDTGSLAASRVPLARVTIILWMLPAAELTKRMFRWRDGVKEIQFGEYGATTPPPKSFEVFCFREYFGRPLEPACVPLPPGLQVLRFGADWDIDLNGARENWPDSLETIEFPHYFNQPLTGDGFMLPRGLLELDLGETFNHPLIGVDWPPLLPKLQLSSRFDQPLEDVKLPSGLQDIYLRDMFNREIGGVVWPKDLWRLEFGASFNQALVSPGAEGGPPLGRKQSLPAGLKRLYYGEFFNQPLDGYELPDGLEVLWIRSPFDFLPSVRWPSRLKSLELQCEPCVIRSTSPIAFPPELEFLMLGFSSPLTTFALPPTLKFLVLGDAFDHPIGWAHGDAPLLPDGLEVLRLGESFNRSIENVRLPVGLKRLIMNSRDNRFDQGLAFPKTLRKLCFGWRFAYSLRGVVLPDTLTRLSFGNNYPPYHLLELDWPRSLRILHVGPSLSV